MSNTATSEDEVLVVRDDELIPRDAWPGLAFDVSGRRQSESFDLDGLVRLPSDHRAIEGESDPNAPLPAYELDLEAQEPEPPAPATERRSEPNRSEPNREQPDDQDTIPPPMTSTAPSSPQFGRRADSQPPLSQHEQLLANKYRVERVIGHSRIAVNAQVRHVELRQRSLLLYLHSGARTHVDLVARFMEGARQALRLSSEHVVRTSDAGRLPNGVPYVAMEYPSGSSLRHMLDIAGPLALTDAVDYVLQAAIALAEAHAAGLAHGHLSTAHLYLGRRSDGRGLVKVLGFGVADALCPHALDEERDDDDVESAFPEGHSLLAPEQLRNDGAADALADIWGLGAVLHELLAGAPVFQAAGPAALVATIAADPPTPITAIRPDVPAGLEALILRCLEKDKHGRFPSIADWAVAVAPFAAPDSQRHVERIVKTIVRGSRAPMLPGRINALVHVGPAPAPESKPPTTSTVTIAPAPAPSRFSLGLVALAATFAVASAGVLGAAVAIRLYAKGGDSPSLAAAAPQLPVAAAAPQLPVATVAPAAAPPVAAPSATALPSAAPPSAAPPPAVVARPAFALARPRSAAPAPRPRAEKSADEREKVAKSEPEDLFGDTR